MLLTLTLPTYGKVRPEGTPAEPASYENHRAAMDAQHFPKNDDRFRQNKRR